MIRLPILRTARRTFIRLPDLTASTQPPVQEHYEERLLSFAPRHFYQVVADVDRYHQFLPSCQASRILSSSSPVYQKSSHTNITHITHRHRAELVVGFQQLSEKYTSQVTCVENECWRRDHYRVSAHASQTHLFHLLETDWWIEPFQSAAVRPLSLVKFQIKFQFRSVLHAQVSSVFFDQLARQMVHAFEKRAAELERR